LVHPRLDGSGKLLRTCALLAAPVQHSVSSGLEELLRLVRVGLVPAKRR
jgi:hypothetical protein